MTLKHWVEIKRSNSRANWKTFSLIAALWTALLALLWNSVDFRKTSFCHFSIYDDSHINSPTNSKSSNSHVLEHCHFWSKGFMMDFCLGRGAFLQHYFNKHSLTKFWNSRGNVKFTYQMSKYLCELSTLFLLWGRI